jgi:antitoxin (DNA-binding transcriptional repressor) of toxin-antitoxin stability system
MCPYPGVLMSESVITITELRNRFDEYFQRVKSGEVFIITKYGKLFAQFAPAQGMSEEEKATLSQSNEDVE